MEEVGGIVLGDPFERRHVVSGAGEEGVEGAGAEGGRAGGGGVVAVDLESCLEERRAFHGRQSDQKRTTWDLYTWPSSLLFSSRQKKKPLINY